MLNVETMSLKAFWEAVEQRLVAFSADELRAVLRAMAQKTPPTERQAFLAKLQPMAEMADVVQQVLQKEDLLADIADLRQEIEEEMGQADDWEEEHGWGEEEYDEEDSLGPYSDFVEPLADLFDRTNAVFDYGNFTLACAAYPQLFAVLELEDDYGRGVSAEDLKSVNIAEARARYLRAVYETEPPAPRSQVLFEQMRRAQLWLARPHLMLEDIIQISPQPLPDREDFLRDWIAFLRGQSGGDADAWLREAIRLAQGTPGLEELARAEGTKRPRAYLDWFAALEQEDKHREVLVAAQEALQTLPAQLPIRAAIADHLCTAAAKLGETEALRAGRWEAFVAKPTLVRLLDLWDAAPRGQEQTRLMHQAAKHVQDYLAHPLVRPEAMGVWEIEDSLEAPAGIDKSVLAHAYLFAEEWDAAYQLAAREEVLGWSSSNNPQGLVVSFFLVLLSGRRPDALPPILAQLWPQGLQNSIGFGYTGEGILTQLERAYTERLSTVSLGRDRQEQFLTWCLDVAQRRVNAIVGNQHRGSYGKAAVLIAACAEVLCLRGDAGRADALLNDVRNRFPRHRSFQAELKMVVQQRR